MNIALASLVGVLLLGGEHANSFPIHGGLKPSSPSSSSSSSSTSSMSTSRWARSSHKKGILPPVFPQRCPSLLTRFSAEPPVGGSGAAIFGRLFDGDARAAVVVTPPSSFRGLSQTFERLRSSAASLPSSIQGSVVGGGGTFLPSLRRVWWMLPMVLAVVPPYCAVARGTCAAMPDWWSVVRMEYIATADNAHWVIGPFLASNLSYFWSGAYLMNRFRLVRNSSSSSGSSGSRRLLGLRLSPNRFAMLGVWVALAGLVSTVFHSVQALGSHALAESLCYIDHAVALSAGLYFVDTCGPPSRSVSCIGALAVVTLVITSPGYAWLHSTWHYLSALAATRWALEGYHSRRSRGPDSPELLQIETTTTEAT